jgi:hypothetical protein
MKSFIFLVAAPEPFTLLPDLVQALIVLPSVLATE